jgi:hypothetical protein
MSNTNSLKAINPVTPEVKQRVLETIENRHDDYFG